MSASACVEDFTEDGYRALLRLARAQWEFVSFAEFDRAGRVLLWRHDVDISMHRALRLAEIEHEERVKSTFFLMLHSTFYNLLEHAVARRVEAILAFGHDIGLHFDPSFYGDRIKSKEQLIGFLERERKILEDCFGVPIKAFSWHNPTVGDWLSMDDHHCGGMVNAYGSGVRSKFTYVSDSNGIWRHSRLQQVLENGEDPSLHVLTHPEWWQKSAMSPRERVFRSVEGRALAVMRQNDALLAEYGRPNLGALDEAFRFLKQQFGRKAELLDYRWMRGESASVFADLWRLFESQMVKFCRVWFRKQLRAHSSEVISVITSPVLRLPPHKVFSAIYGCRWNDVSGKDESEYESWQAVRNYLVHGLSSYPQAKLQDGIIFLVSVMQQLAAFGKAHPLGHDVVSHAALAGLPRAKVVDGACRNWVYENRQQLDISDRKWQRFVDLDIASSSTPGGRHDTIALILSVEDGRSDA